MLFNSMPFLFGFLPVTCVVFFCLGRKNGLLAGLWLATASLIFYGWWNPSFVPLLVSSVIFNYGSGLMISREITKSANNLGRSLLILAITADLLLLGYFKYAGFFSEIANELLSTKSNLGHVILPLGISFFTFTQIAFLVDTYQGKAKEFNFIHYMLFVTYFPHLIAGPILHHGQMMPQFAERRIYKIDWWNISAGLTIFVIGLAKKVLIADSFSKIATPIFSAAQGGVEPLLIEAWAGALAYTLQIYFDFSGYSDMAIGLSLFFNIRLPLNFNSPYKSSSIIEFWHRWHMTLSVFLRDYLYIPLGGNRKGKARRYLNLFATMLLGGLWHGAGWTFVIWGALHGFYLVTNHGYRALSKKLGWRPGTFGRLGTPAAVSLTFILVVIAWVFFRADSLAAASAMLNAMVNGNGWRSAAGWHFAASGINGTNTALMIGAGLSVVWLLPNTQEFMHALPCATPVYGGIAEPKGWAALIVWRPMHWLTWSSFGILLALSILVISPAKVSEFLYYQF